MRHTPTRLPYSMCVSVAMSRMGGGISREYSPHVSLIGSPSSCEYSAPSS
jgi:hypothetical protein